jgi:hypothetical protein
MSPGYYKRLKARRLERSRKGVAARERKRLGETFDGPDWSRVRTMIVGVYAHRDGLRVGIWIDGKPWKCGSERAVRGALARVLYRRKPHA